MGEKKERKPNHVANFVRWQSCAKDPPLPGVVYCSVIYILRCNQQCMPNTLLVVPLKLWLPMIQKLVDDLSGLLDENWWDFLLFPFSYIQGYTRCCILSDYNWLVQLLSIKIVCQCFEHEVSAATGGISLCPALWCVCIADCVLTHYSMQLYFML